MVFFLFFLLDLRGGLEDELREREADELDPEELDDLDECRRRRERLSGDSDSDALRRFKLSRVESSTSAELPPLPPVGLSPGVWGGGGGG